MVACSTTRDATDVDDNNEKKRINVLGYHDKWVLSYFCNFYKTNPKKIIYVSRKARKKNVSEIKKNIKSTKGTTHNASGAYQKKC